MITQEELKRLLHYDPDTGLFTWLVRTGPNVYAGNIAGYLHKSTGYIRCTYDGQKYQSHRLAWLYTHGQYPSNLLDHINGNKTDNRLSNLREATYSENSQNRSKAGSNNVSGFLGVSFHKVTNKFRSQIKLFGKTTYLGAFKTPEEAYEVYLKAKRELHPFGNI